MSKSRNGFTLVELLIVVTIIGILAVIFIPSALNAPAKARDAQRISDLLAISNALNAARTDGISLPSYTTPNYCVNDTVMSSYLNYLPNGKTPRDPSNLRISIIGSQTPCAAGEYLVRMYNPSGTYTQGFRFGVFAKMEDPLKGNILCVWIGTSAGSPLTTDKIGSGTNCYGVKSQ